MTKKLNSIELEGMDEGKKKDKALLAVFNLRMKDIEGHPSITEVRRSHKPLVTSAIYYWGKTETLLL